MDTGYYLEETWAFLEGKRVDLLIMDCTFAAMKKDPHSFGHHTFLSYIESLNRMKETGFITAETRVFGTHFNPHQALFHEEMEALLRESAFPITAAYDGLKL